MRILPPVRPTPEQLAIIANTRPGYVRILGAAGSGKTTTALLRLRQLCNYWLARRTRLELVAPVRVLVLTYNRTLEGYITELARQQVVGHPGLQLEVHTFSKWAMALIGGRSIQDAEARGILRSLVAPLRQDADFLIEEVDYLLGRFEPERLEEYVTARREGRGTSPRFEHTQRRMLLDEVVNPYAAEKAARGIMDWNDLALTARNVETDIPPWDVVIVDEAQDFTANQVRAVIARLADPFSATFVVDAAQRIYPRYFAWSEVGIETWAGRHSLRRNYRNTRQIATFARQIVDGLPMDDDGTLPDFAACTEDGPVPVIVAGRYSRQLDYMIEWILSTVDLSTESIAFLHPKGGGWFDFLRQRLHQVGLPWAELTRQSTWPTGPEAIALSTLHSAKGLEFDHVLLPGLNAEVMSHGDEEGDVQLESLRRLLAMGIGRARRTVMLGYKPDDAPTVLGLLGPETYELVNL